jgi:heptosyltransferase-2
MTFKEFTLYLASYIYALVRGSAKTQIEQPKRVLVWQMAKLGDMVCTTPMFRALKVAYPEVLVTVVGNAINRQVLEGNLDVDEYLVFNGFFPMLHLMRSQKYDAAFVTAPSTIALAILFLGGARSIHAPRIVGGVSPYETSLYRGLLPLVSEHPHQMGKYAPREYLRLLEGVHINTDDTRKHLAYSKPARARVETFLKEHNLVEKKFVALSPSAGNKIKRWPPERFARVAEHLVASGFPVVVIGGPRDREEVMEMMHTIIKPERIINALELFSIDELKALLAFSGMFIAVDTGPIYIAEAFDVPTIDIVGPMNEDEQPPIGPRHIIVTPPGSRTPQLAIMNARCYDAAEAVRQTEAITTDMVLAACDALLRL